MESLQIDFSCLHEPALSCEELTDVFFSRNVFFSVIYWNLFPLIVVL